MRSITARSGSHIPLKRLRLRHVAATAVGSVEEGRLGRGREPLSLDRFDAGVFRRFQQRRFEFVD